MAKKLSHYTNESMWAVGWMSYDGREFPPVAEAGACKIFATQEQALDSRMDLRQNVVEARVTLEFL